MAISYPRAMPTPDIAEITLHVRDAIGLVPSPFTYQAETQDFGGQCWEADVFYPPMRRGGSASAEAEEVVAWLVSLRGMLGTFLMGDPYGATPRGTWAGTPQVAGAHSAGAAELALDGFTAGATVKMGDYLNTGSGSTTHLYKVLADGTANGSGQLTVDIWPHLRTSLADNDAIVKSAAKGLWRLASNQRSWSIRQASVYGIRFSCVEAL